MIRLSLGLLGLVMLVSCGGKQETSGSGKEMQKFETMLLNNQAAELHLIYPVTIRGEEDVEIRPRVEGFIKDIFVDEGSTVKKGQRMFQVESPSTEADLRNAEAAVKSAEASVNTAKINIERLRPLAEKNIISKVQLETTENNYQTALAGKAQAEASLKNARIKHGWSTVTSPVDGVVGALTYRKGSLVNSSNTLTMVANIGKIYAYFSLNEEDLMALLNRLPGESQKEKIANIPPVTLKLKDGSEYPEKGKIETISGVVNIATGSVNLRVEFPNKNGILKSGSSGRVIIPEILENVFVIPQNSTFARQNKIIVYKVQGDSVVQTLIETKVMPDGQSYAVTGGGLSEGDRIVAKGINHLSDGMKIAY
jgi:membrane fusion protein (multidrug efflux system)